MITSRESLLLIITTPLYASVILLEIILSAWHGRNLYSWRGIFHNFLLTCTNAGLDLLVRGFYVGILVWFWQHRVAEVINPWLYWPLLLLLEDFAFYWLHRVDHYCRLFWAAHVTHHSSEEFNLTVGFRSSVFQPLYRFVYFLPLAWLGFRAEDILFVYSATQMWGILVHTQYNIRLGWLEWIMVTPAHHRVHHASNVVYLDRNMGMMLIIWDRLFGTFADEDPDEPVRYGLTTSLVNQRPDHIILHEWQKLAHDLRKPGPLSQKLNYIFAPPGWSHDGSSLTANEMRAQLTKPAAEASVNEHNEAASVSA
jgi:sterol desaturase/sphingolipid hydroxylase (fatty acid hydroxylase superfamily)